MLYIMSNKITLILTTILLSFCLIGVSVGATGSQLNFNSFLNTTENDGYTIEPECVGSFYNNWCSDSSIDDNESSHFDQEIFPTAFQQFIKSEPEDKIIEGLDCTSQSTQVRGICLDPLRPKGNSAWDPLFYPSNTLVVSTDLSGLYSYNSTLFDSYPKIPTSNNLFSSYDYFDSKIENLFSTNINISNTVVPTSDMFNQPSYIGQKNFDGSYNTCDNYSDYSEYEFLNSCNSLGFKGFDEGIFNASLFNSIAQDNWTTSTNVPILNIQGSSSNSFWLSDLL
jgi:hypothetical protein